MGVAAWGHRWTSQLGDLPINADGTLTVAGALWIHQLAGISQRAVQQAVADFAGTDDWPPPLAQVRKRALGIPTIDHVRADLAKLEHGFTRLVLAQLDSWAFSRADQRTADAMLRAAYDSATEQRLQGGEYPLPPAGQLEQFKPEPRPATPETVAKARAEIERLYGTLSPQEQAA